MPVITTTTVENFLNCPKCGELMQERCHKCGVRVEVFGGKLQGLPEHMVDRVQAAVDGHTVRTPRCLWCGEPTTTEHIRVILVQNGPDEVHSLSQGGELCDSCNDWVKRYNESLGRAVMWHARIMAELMGAIKKISSEMATYYCHNCPYSTLEPDDVDDWWHICGDCRWYDGKMQEPIPILRDMRGVIDRASGRIDAIRARYASVKSRHIAACSLRKAEAGW